MADDRARLDTALRDIAADDAAHAPTVVDPRLTAAFVSQYAARGMSPEHGGGSRFMPGRLLGFGIAAMLAAAFSSALWFVSRRSIGDTRSSAGRDSGRDSGRAEVATAFMPLTYSAVPYTEIQILRLEVPRSALETFGLAPAELPAEATSAVSQSTVLADVIVGEDGLARAVRFVRAERAPGAAP